MKQAVMCCLFADIGFVERVAVFAAEHRPSSASITAGQLLPDIWYGGPSLRLMNADAVLHVEGIFSGRIDSRLM